MTNRRMMMGGGATGLFKDIELAFASFNHADGTPLTGITESGLDHGFVDWEEGSINGGTNVLECQFNGLAYSGSNTQRIARNTVSLRSILPIGMRCTIFRGSIDDTGATVGLGVFANKVQSMATFTSEADSDALDLPVGVGLYTTRFSLSEMQLEIFWREPGEANATILTPSIPLIAPIGGGAGNSKQVGFIWQNSKIKAFWQTNATGLDYTESEEFTLSPAPWQDGNHDRVSFLYKSALTSGRHFDDSLRLAR